MSRLIKRDGYYEIENYEPIITRDEHGNVTSGIFCPYIPAFLIERSSFTEEVNAVEDPEFDFNAKKHHDAVNKILEDIYKEIEEEENGTSQKE